nr:Chain P, Envelope glycoprotein 9-residue peptide [Human immunodeficiency virus 1]
IGPGRAFYA